MDVTIPEETIIAQWIDKQNGILAQRRVYSWSNPDFDDFYIVDLTFTNIGDFDGDGVGEAPGPINNLYIAFKNVAAMTAMGILEEFGWNFYASNARGMDDTMWYTEADGYPNAFSANGAFVGRGYARGHPQGLGQSVFLARRYRRSVLQGDRAFQLQYPADRRPAESAKHLFHGAPRVRGRRREVLVQRGRPRQIRAARGRHAAAFVPVVAGPFHG